MTATADYRTSSRRMMAQSRVALEQGDLQQASEKGWGAATQMLGSVADARGRQHGRRRRLRQIASRLRAELGDPYIYLLLGAASMRPENFYENQIAIPDIR